MRAVGNLCVGGDSRYDARRMVGLLIAGLLQPMGWPAAIASDP